MENKTGRIIKGIGGFYYVKTTNNIYECKAKGNFKNKNIKLLVGDIVDITINNNSGNIFNIHERKNFLIRPNIANIDQILIFMSISNPKPNFLALDKIIINYMKLGIPIYIIFNKIDEANQNDIDLIRKIYCQSKIPIYFISAKEKIFGSFLDILKDKFSILSGNSGVGKSTFLNSISTKKMEVGSISEKIKRGKHTTRHSEIFQIDDSTFIADTPGFGKFDIIDIEPDELSTFYYEFDNYKDCKFNKCSHIFEPGCKVKEALTNGNISSIRYENFKNIYLQLKENKNEY